MIDAAEPLVYHRSNYVGEGKHMKKLRHALLAKRKQHRLLFFAVAFIFGMAVAQSDWLHVSSAKDDKSATGESRSTTLDGARIHYVNYGKGNEALVLVHAKTVYREAGCEEQGFSAFLGCPHADWVPNSLVIAIDPKAMEVVGVVEAPEFIGGRLTTTNFNGKDYVYLAGTTTAFRYIYEDNEFRRDKNWDPGEIYESPHPVKLRQRA
jgi:hypothetical protein